MTRRTQVGALPTMLCAKQFEVGRLYKLIDGPYSYHNDPSIEGHEMGNLDADSIVLCLTKSTRHNGWMITVVFKDKVVYLYDRCDNLWNSWAGV